MLVFDLFILLDDIILLFEYSYNRVNHILLCILMVCCENTKKKKGELVYILRIKSIIVIRDDFRIMVNDNRRVDLSFVCSRINCDVTSIQLRRWWLNILHIKQEYSKAIRKSCICYLWFTILSKIIMSLHSVPRGVYLYASWDRFKNNHAKAEKK